MHQPMENFRKKLESNEVTVGACVSMADRCVCEVLGYAGCDFLWIDMEHSMSDRQEVFGHIIASRAGNTAAFVRVPYNDPILVKPILDMGVDGIIFPNVKSAAEARLAVESTLYPLSGIRGYGPVRANGYNTIPNSDFLPTDKDVYCIVQIEHVEAVERIEEICQVEGVDCIMFGAMDLSGSLNQMGQHDTPEFIKAVDTVCAAAKKYNKTLGACVGYSQSIIEFWLDRGIKVFIGGMDSYLLREYTAMMVNDVRDYAQKTK